MVVDGPQQVIRGNVVIKVEAIGQSILTARLLPQHFQYFRVEML